MKQKLLLVIAVAFLFTACNNEKKEDGKTEKSKDSITKNEPYTMPDSATMMKAMMEYGTPGDMHKMMASWDGT